MTTTTNTEALLRMKSVQHSGSFQTWFDSLPHEDSLYLLEKIRALFLGDFNGFSHLWEDIYELRIERSASYFIYMFISRVDDSVTFIKGNKI
jgi:putative component of toxin-antitoxin plasmid stabilization module